MNNRYYQTLLEKEFSPEFAADIEAVCDKHNISDAYFATRIYDLLQESYDKDDVIKWLENDRYYPSLAELAENDKFVESLVYWYRRRYDNEYGTWDNITMAFSYMADMPEWKNIIDAAEEDD